MRTTHPATGTAHAFVHFAAHHDQVSGSRLRFNTGYRPADPLIAGQRRYALPHSKNLRVGQYSLSHIRRQCMYRATRKFFRKHAYIVAQDAGMHLRLVAVNSVFYTLRLRLHYRCQVIGNL